MGAASCDGAPARMEQMPFDRLPRRAFLAAALGLVVTACSQTSRSSTGGGAAAPVVTLPNGERAPVGSVPPVAAAPAAISSVGMIGDSITKLSTPSLTTMFESQGITPTIDAEVSRRIKVGSGKGDEPLNGEQVLTNLTEFGLDPDAWVFALGTNDLTAYDEDGFAELIDTMLGMTKDGVPVVWVDTYRPKTKEQTDLFNSTLRARAAQRPNTSVASWFDVASADPKKLISKDQVHPTEAGEVAFATLVGDAVAALG